MSELQVKIGNPFLETCCRICAYQVVDNTQVICLLMRMYVIVLYVYYDYYFVGGKVS